MNSEKTYVFPPPCSVAHRTLISILIMAHIKEPKGVDFIIQSPPLT